VATQPVSNRTRRVRLPAGRSTLPRAMATMGRPSKLTPEIQDKIVSAIRAGNYGEVAAAYAGIGSSTFYRWMDQGKAQAGPYREFREAVKAAESEAEVRAVAIVQKQMPEHWQAAMTYLERKFPLRWGRRVDVTSGDEPIRPRPVETVLLPACLPEKDAVLVLESLREKGLLPGMKGSDDFD
jgi:hypothetical protein